MNNLIRRALVGDREAQKECTKQGIVLPCPFCGGEAKFFVKCSSERGCGWQFGIYCSECNLTMPKTDYQVQVQLNEFGDVVTIVDERDKAIEAWNRRIDNDT